MLWWQLLIVIVGGLLLWLALLATLLITQRHNRDPTSLRDAVRLLPDVIRLLRRLAADPDLPRGVRVRLGLLLGYLLLPIDLVPDCCRCSPRCSDCASRSRCSPSPRSPATPPASP